MSALKPRTGYTTRGHDWTMRPDPSLLTRTEASRAPVKHPFLEAFGLIVFCGAGAVALIIAMAVL